MLGSWPNGQAHGQEKCQNLTTSRVCQLSFVITAVVPIFGLIGLGLAAARWRWLSESAGKGITEFTFLVALPALLFRTMVTANLGETQPLLLLASYFVSVAVIWLVSTLAAYIVAGRSGPETAVFAMCASYGNIVLLGIPIAISAFGAAAAPTAAVIVSTHVAILWLAACFHLALVTQGGTSSVPGILRSVVVDFTRNPIVVAIVIGLLWRLTGLGLHGTVERGMQMLAKASVPCALFAVGFSLTGFRAAGELRTLSTLFVLKNLAMPVVAWVITTQVFGVTGLAAIIIVLFTAMPTGTATFLFASSNGIAVQTASEAVALSTGLSMLTLPVVLLLLAAFQTPP